MKSEISFGGDKVEDRVTLKERIELISGDEEPADRQALVADEVERQEADNGMLTGRDGAFNFHKYR